MRARQHDGIFAIVAKEIGDGVRDLDVDILTVAENNFDQKRFLLGFGQRRGDDIESIGLAPALRALAIAAPPTAPTHLYGIPRIFSMTRRSSSLGTQR
jgi:hypothetical protein